MKMFDWTEKYRPKKLDEIVGNNRAIVELRKWADEWKRQPPKFRAVILSGKAGTGKTSSALALANEYNWTPIELNTSDARNAEKIKNVATSGAINETFSDNGTYVSSQQGGRKLIILDEADNLYERIERSASNSATDLSDKGGKKAIIDTIKITNQPIVLIVNDYYKLIRGSGEILKRICKQIRFYDPYSSSIVSLLKRISLSEGLTVDQKVLQSIADGCKGDIRSAVNDLQSICLDKTRVDITSLNVLGFRDREKDIFAMLREIFKTKNIQSLRESVTHLDIDPKLLLLWINENLPRQYLDFEDLTKGYDSVSKADVFLGRTFRRQHFGLWSYACDFMNGGVALSKTHNYTNDVYKFPTWLSQKKMDKTEKFSKDTIIEKIGNLNHSSNRKTNEFIFNYFKSIFCNNTHFAIKMKKKLDLTESETQFLLGKSHAHKLKEIMLSSELEDQKTIKVEEKPAEEIEEEKRDIQQSLLDF